MTFRSQPLIRVFLCSMTFSLLAQAQFTQQAELAAVGDPDAYGTHGAAVALSGDGNTAIVGCGGSGPGAAFVFARTGAVWTLQGKLVGTGAVEQPEYAFQGSAVALSADGNTAIIGGLGDNNYTGAAWVFTRSGGVWTQQGPKLVGSGFVGATQGVYVYQGTAVALSGDGNTAVIGGSGDNNFTGAAWVFTRTNQVWTQQGSKLVGSGAVGNPGQGASVALAGDGNTAVLGGGGDNGGAGAAWVFTRSAGVWAQQGSKLIGSGAAGPFGAGQGRSVALSGDGNTVILGGPGDNGSNGAVWVFIRTGAAWSQQGPKLAASSLWGTGQGHSVGLSGDGNRAIVGARSDNHYTTGAAWLFGRNGGVWSQQGSQLVGSGDAAQADIGPPVAISGDGDTAMLGDVSSAASALAGWVFVPPTVLSIAASQPPNQTRIYPISSARAADGFTLTAPATIAAIRFWAVAETAASAEPPGGFYDAFNGFVSWAIHTNTGGLPGAIVASGAASSIWPIPTGAALFGSLHEFSLMFNITPPVALGPGTYWLELHEGPNPAADDGAGIYWETGYPSYNSTAAFSQAALAGGFALNSSQDHLAFEVLAAVGPLLSVTKTHSVNVTIGQTATYTLTVGNAAPAAPTNGPVIVTEGLPAGLTLSSMAGANWNCSFYACTRSDVLAPGSQYEPITVTVSVNSDAPAQATNQAYVLGGGWAGSAATDPTSIYVPVVVTTNIPGLSVIVDGTTYTAPHTFSWPSGSSHGVNVSFTQGSGGTRYIFANWSGGASQDGSVTATAPTTITGNFITQYQLTTSVSPPGSGSVSVSPTSSDGYYNAGASLNLTASPAAGYVFSSYTPPTFSGVYSPSFSVGMTGPVSVVVSFAPLTSCDLSQQATTSASDVQKVIGQALGVMPAANDLNRDGKVNSTDVQITINAAIGLGCSAP